MDGPKRRLERLACDRCHRQKLRCSRASHSSRACQRCVKAGERCTYSPPLRLGRPATGSKSGSQARCKSNDKNQRQASPPTPSVMPVGPCPQDSFESLADATGPPTPPLCLDRSPSFDACHDQSLHAAAITRLSASPVFAEMPEPSSSDYLITPASTTGLDGGGDEAFLMDSDYTNDTSLDASMLLDMCPEQPDYLITPTSTTDEFCLYPMDPCPSESLMTEGGQRSGSHDGPERQLLKLQQSLDGLQRTIDLTTRASDMLLSTVMTLMTSTSARLSSPPPSMLDRPLAPSTGGRSHVGDLMGATVNSESHVKNALSATLDLLGNNSSQHGHGMYFGMQ